MKFKKIVFAASGLAVGSGLLGTILTSCSCAKPDIDSKLKIDLNDDGWFYTKTKDGELSKKIGFADAVKDALSRSTNWAQFKTALANEIVYRWYEDRATKKQSETDKNTTFRINIDEWNKQIDKDWENTVKTVKNKYGKNYEFYLQNEYLAPNGGTEAAYKRTKLVEKARAEFISKVFANNYFGYKEQKKAVDGRDEYPIIYTAASSNIAKENLNDPANWPSLGFFARTNPSFQPGDSGDIDTNYLAKNPDGDYATIQNYVFDRWFKTEKPFFSAAALFKYSNPSTVKNLTDIYDETKTKIGTDKEAGKATETFPFFGGSDVTAGATGTRAYKAFLDDLEEGNFETLYTKDGKRVSNGTIKIDKGDTEDSQTLLLCFGNKIHSGSSDSLVVPYANAAASLYMQMFAADAATAEKYMPKTATRDQATIVGLLKGIDLNNDNMAILGNFFFTTKPASGSSYLDLNTVYGNNVVGESKPDEEYHCPLFLDNQKFNYFYGGAIAPGGKHGIRFISNTFQTELGKKKDATTYENTQPWIFELNTYGMHAQTIDGFKYVTDKAAEGTSKNEALKNVLKYRLMQKKCFSYDWISSSVFGDSGKLKSYFNDNFTDIILEMATNTTDKALNIFRPIASFNQSPKLEDVNFLKVLADDNAHKFGYDALVAYITATNEYDAKKKLLDAYIATNSKIQEYRTKQIENAKISVEHRKTIFANGLLAPTPYLEDRGSFDSKNNIKNIIFDIASIDLMENGEIQKINKTTLQDLLTGTDGITDKAEALFADAKPNLDNKAFSPQIAAAKKAMSNRFWYKSYIADKVMYSYMGTKEGMANAIKMDAIDQYLTKTLGDNKKALANDPNIQTAFMLTYGESKLLSNGKTYANYGKAGETDAGDVTKEGFYYNLANGYSQFKSDTERENGVYGAESYNEKAFQAALAYLIGDLSKDTAWTNFYKALNSKISDDEMAFTGYLSKLYTDVEPTATKEVTDLSASYANGNHYAWTSDVNNIFNEEEWDNKNARTTADQYWHVIKKAVGESAAGAQASLAGFTGIQTKTNNQLDSTSKLQEAALDKLAESVDESRILTNASGVAEEFKHESTAGAGDWRYNTNYGCWFAYAGTKDTNGDYYKFDKITFDKTEISSDDFIEKDAGGTVTWVSPALKLAKKISRYKTPDDLRSLCAKLGNAFNGYTIFRDIGDGTKVMNDPDEIKITMLQELPRKTDATTKLKNAECFQRLTDVEVHTNGTHKEAYKYLFDDKKGNGFKLILTQINKSDIIEKTLTPEWDGGKFNKKANNPLELSEFFYILCQLANESSIQQLAISDVVKQVYGDDKLVVYDAQLYNQFDSTWIKDWSKKTIGL